MRQIRRGSKDASGGKTLPIFTDLLAVEVIERSEKQAVVKHPNTAWRLVIHEGGPNAANKPHTNHYGFRVANSREIPQAYEYISDHKESSDKFLEHVLGLSIIGGGRTSTYITVPSGPWYVVVLPTTHRDYLTAANRFTVKVASAEEVADAHKEFSTKGRQLGVQDLWDLQENGRTNFIFSDISKNWWEVTS